MKRFLTPVLVLILLLAFVIPTAMAVAKPSGDKGKTTIKADDAIVSIHAIGFVDTDGAKLSAIDIEYSVDMEGSDVGLDKYEITDYGLSVNPACELGSDPGVATGFSVDGTHVIIEVNTDYQMARVASSYKWAMMAGVTQKRAIHAGNVNITPNNKEVKNYEEVAVWNDHHAEWEYFDYATDGTYTIEGTEVFDLFTKGDGAFLAEDCWEEATGEYVEVELPYALYVPDDYNPANEYALVLHIHDAGFMGDDPMIALTESQGAVNFSTIGDAIARDDGLGGLIVVCPQICNELRSTRDDYSLSAAVPATWQLMDYLTGEYNIDPDRIYGEGQSMGGMHVGAMAAQRDNYFAAWWANGCQWGSNFCLDDPTYNGVPYYEAPQDGDPIWTEDSDGNPVNYRNWYYLVSDDNILINNCMSDNFSTSVWKELKYLYMDLVGAEFPYTYWNPLTESKEAQNAALEALFAEPQPDDLGIYWAAFEGGNHMATWIYSHGVSAAYDWLLTQTRDSEMARDKLDLNKPFELAEVQLEEPDRAIAGGTDYLVTGKYGAGTLYYNSALYGRGGRNLIMPPGWWPLEAGAGLSPIVFDPAMFPIEGFSGVVHDDPYARVLVLEGDIKVAICSLELVNIPSESIDDCKAVVSAATGVPVENVWVHATHAITTPHLPGHSHHSPGEEEKAPYYLEAVHDAITDAAQQAADSFQRAFAGWGTGNSYVSINKDVMFPDYKWYMGLPGPYVLNTPLPSNKQMTVLRLDSLFGDPIGFFVGHGTKPTCIDNSEMGAVTRQISSDVPGLMCRLMEAEYGVPTLFGMSAAGDQVTRLWAYPQEWDPIAEEKIQADYGVATGLAYVDTLGTEMFTDAKDIADGISSTKASGTIAITQGYFVADKKDTTTTEVPVGVIRFGDSAFVGFKPELNAVTEQQLWAASPYEHTLLLSFLNVDQRYMPDAYACYLNTTEYQKSPYVQGTAEQLVDYATLLLESLK